MTDIEDLRDAAERLDSLAHRRNELLVMIEVYLGGSDDALGRYLHGELAKWREQSNVEHLWTFSLMAEYETAGRES